jgi:RimJ/RimL family protein N-acetyltransferase
MLSFYELGEDNICVLRKYLEENPAHFCDLTMGNIFMWRNELKTFFSVRNDTLIIRKEYEKGRYCYLYPLGLDPLGALEAIEEYSLEHHEQLEFYALDEEKASLLSKRYAFHQVTSLREWSDYLYTLSDLRDFPGKRYEGKRHNANRFHRENPTALFKEAKPEDLPRLEAFLQDYLKENEGKDISFDEIAYTKEMIRHPGCLLAQIGYYELAGKIIGFALGETIGDCLYEHIEKALRSYEGIYQALTSDFLKMFGGNTRYLNREEDDGNDGLREAKLQLKPVALLDKYFLEVTNAASLVKTFEDLQGPRLRLSTLKENEKESYARLALDENNNRYWGYDYQNDLKAGEEATPEYFYEGVKSDLEEKRFVTYAIHDEKGSFIGEAVLYRFTSLKSAELGTRLFKEYQGKGYAKEALSLLLAYAKDVLSLKTIYVESYFENLPSIHLIESLGFFRESAHDGKYLYRKALQDDEGVGAK